MQHHPRDCGWSLVGAEKLKGKPSLMSFLAMPGGRPIWWWGWSKVTASSAILADPPSWMTLYRPWVILGIPSSSPLGPQIMHLPPPKGTENPLSLSCPTETRVYPTSGEYRTSMRHRCEMLAPFGMSTTIFPFPAAWKSCLFFGMGKCEMWNQHCKLQYMRWQCWHKLPCHQSLSQDQKCHWQSHLSVSPWFLAILLLLASLKQRENMAQLRPVASSLGTMSKEMVMVMTLSPCYSNSFISWKPENIFSNNEGYINIIIFTNFLYTCPH